MSEYTETIATREHEGVTYRARVHLDLYAADSKPDGDYFGYVFTVDGRRTELLGKAYSTPDADFYLSSLWERYRDWDLIREALKGELAECVNCGEQVEHDDTSTCDRAECTCLPTETFTVHEDDCPVPLAKHVPSEDYVDHDVVDLDWLSRGDHDIVNVVTKQDLEIWGWNKDGERVHTPTHDDGTPMRPTEHNLDEWRAWADGDVYFFTIEKAVKWQRLGSDDEPVFIAEEPTMTTWEEVETLGTFYGDEYAKEAALESLDSFAPVTQEA